MKITALKRRRRFAGAVALGFAALALAAPAAVAAGPPFASTPTIDGGYAAGANDVGLVVTGEKAYGFDAPSVTPAVAPASSWTLDWDVFGMALGLAVALSMLALLGVVVSRRSRAATMAHA